jgi:aconitate hydratase
VTVRGIEGRDPAELLARDLDVEAGDIRFTARSRIDTPTEAVYYRHGGILPFVARQLVAG